MRTLFVTVLLATTFLVGCDAKKVESLTARVAELETKLTEADKTAARVPDLENAVKAGVDQVAALRTDLSKATAGIEHKDQQLLDKARELELCKVGTTAQQNRADLAEKALADLRAERDSLRGTGGDQSRLLEQLRAQMASLETDRTSLRSSLDAATARAAAAEAQLASTREKSIVVTRGPTGVARITEELKATPEGQFVRDGIYERKYDNGANWYRVKYANGKPVDGTVTMYHKSGAKEFEGVIKNAKLDGEWLMTDERGQTILKLQYRDGVAREVAAPDANGVFQHAAVTTEADEKELERITFVISSLLPGMDVGAE